MKDTKDTLRKEAKRHRAFITPLAEEADQAADNFFASLSPAPGQIIAGYWPQDREFDIYPILERLFAQGNVCALPVIQSEERVLRFAAWNGKDDLVSGPFGVLQPAVNEQTQWVEPDIVIVPLLAFDRQGYRLGHGGGYYDATLKALRDKKDILAVGLAYGQQAVLFNLPVEPHDQRLDWVITPTDAYYYE